MSAIEIPILPQSRVRAVKKKASWIKLFTFILLTS